MYRECLAETRMEFMCEDIYCKGNATMPSIPPIPSIPPLPSIPVLPSFTSRPTPRPTISPYPTRFIRPVFSPFPSRLPLRTPLPTNIRIPERISSSLRFPNANPEELKKPERIQTLIASLACVLRVNVETIEIKNITWVKADGQRIPIEFDAAFTRMMGNTGSCAITGQRMLRRLQSTGASVVVTYEVVNPPQEVAYADPTTLTEALNTPQMNALANSVGSSGVLVESPSQPSSSSTTATSTALIAGVAVAAVIAAVGIAGFAYERRRRKARTVLVESQPHTTRVVMNPVSARHMFGVQQTRVGTRV
jgi:hypothetical protein